MVNVVFLIGQLSCGGTERQLLLLIKSLDRAKFRPWVICLSNDASMAALLAALDCHTYVLNRPDSGRLATLLRVLRLVRSIRPRIVHSFGFTAKLGTVASRVIRGCKHITAIRTDPQWQSSWEKCLDRIVLESCDAILANSKQALRTLDTEGIAPRGRVRVVYNGLDLAAFDASRTDLRVGSSDAIEVTGTSSHVICAVASLTPVKDVATLLRAFVIVLESQSQTELWLVGDGPLRLELESIAANLRIDNRVRFLGMRSDVPGILRKATLGVNSSLIEGLSNSIIEYMAASLPVVATDVGGNRELVLHRKTGFLVAPGDARQLAKALLMLLNNPDIRLRFGTAGRGRVVDHFTLQRMISDTELLYEELLANDSAERIPSGLGTDVPSPTA